MNTKSVWKFLSDVAQSLYASLQKLIREKFKEKKVFEKKGIDDFSGRLRQMRRAYEEAWQERLEECEGEKMPLLLWSACGAEFGDRHLQGICNEYKEMAYLIEDCFLNGDEEATHCAALGFVETMVNVLDTGTKKQKEVLGTFFEETVNYINAYNKSHGRSERYCFLRVATGKRPLRLDELS